MRDIQDKNVFMVLGHHPNKGGIVTVVVADDDTEARTIFSERKPDFTPISWPSLADLRTSVEVLAAVKEGRRLPADYADTVEVFKSEDWKTQKSKGTPGKVVL